jgi:uncharacterized repeat protein (TIGR04076 family)
MAARLSVEVESIEGRCPIYSVGDRFILKDAYVIDTAGSDPICLHSLASFMPFYVALGQGIEPSVLGLAGPEPGAAYFQCPDPCRLTGGATVVFRVQRE